MRDTRVQVGLDEGTNTGPSITLDRPRIWMDSKVHAQIEQFAASDTSRELGGMLLGDVRQVRSTLVVKILAAVEAQHTRSFRSSVTFTHDSWADMHRVKDDQYPSMRIVGWFHTHPAAGVFLSAQDVFIHERFFDLNWQVAYVVDPVQDARGFFRWEADRVVAADEAECGIGAAGWVPRARSSARTVAVVCTASLLLLAAVLCLSHFRHPEGNVKLPPAPVAAGPEPAPGKDYTVARGDTLWGIARREYGDGRLYSAIASANRLSDARFLQVGQNLRIPTAPTGAGE